MISKNSDNLWTCNTARYKLKESKYWLECLKKSEIYQDDKLADFYLNTFLSTSCSIPDYVKSDFIHVRISPRFEWEKWKDTEIRKKEIEKHPQKDALENFKKFNDEEYNNFRSIPLINHWFYRRNTVTHRRWDGFKASYSLEDDGTIASVSRFLESGAIPDLRICDEKISKEKNDELLKYLSRNDAIKILHEVLEHFEIFITEFEGQDFFKIT